MGRNEHTPLLLIHQPPVIHIQESNHYNFSLIVKIRQGRAFLATFIFFACIIWLLLSLSIFPLRAPTLPRPPPIYNVAIIGAGPAGIAAAQHLHRSSTANDVIFDITIFESSPVVGGMLALHGPDGEPVFPNDDPMQGHITAEDVAGNALMWQNSLFTRDSEVILGDKVGFTELGTEQVGQAAKFNTEGDLRQGMLKAPVTTDPEKIFTSLGVLEHLQQWAGNLLAKRGISDRYAAEILEPQVQRSFGQRLGHVTGFAAMLAAAQEDSANAYTGGHMIERLERIVRKICVRVRTSTRVFGIKYDEQGKQWDIEHESEREASIDTFDKVILAGLGFSINLESSDSGVYNLSSFYQPDLDGPEDDYFHSIYVTFFTVNTKLPTWGSHDQVLFLNGTGGVLEIKLVRETTSYTATQYLYRVLSQVSVTGTLKRQYDVLWDYETWIPGWQPVRSPLFRMPTLEWPVARGLWFSSLIQHAWSTVDLNWLVGKACADA
ncbi:hypothetical protein EKO27_g11277 [Xylaria grammica]|uniref:Prenylcysteine lyase domain-containing protein n=1 Tax=Xylaria grammica TaxID=363999 RepID=A0A439CNT9_9PEZI|nr:hypothetical protein EKO27_g11277 [Xylaria grammica]